MFFQNINQRDLTKIKRIEFDDDLLSIPVDKLNAYNDTKSSVAVENLEAATGGRDFESIEEITGREITTRRLTRSIGEFSILKTRLQSRI